MTPAEILGLAVTWVATMGVLVLISSGWGFA